MRTASSVAGGQLDPFRLPAALPAEALAAFARDGFLAVPRVLPADFVTAANEEIDACFAGDFSADGGYPDEWYWRKEMSLPNVTRHMTNVWKSSRIVARLALSSSLGQVATQLMRWAAGSRIGNDSVWIKPPGAGSTVAFHSDLWYIPTSSAITCWFALTDVTAESGTLEYVPGSHRWPRLPAISRDEFHGAGRGASDVVPPGTPAYRATAYECAARAGVDPSTVRFESAVVPAGAVVFHHGATFHGSDVNKRADLWRRSLGVHLIPADSQHGLRDGYIYGRYRTHGSLHMSETAFPITYTPAGYVSPFVRAHLLDEPA